MEIRDARLYRTTHETFEAYCRERWGMQWRHAYRLMDAAATIENLSHGTGIAPASERQARPLTRLEPEQQREAWQEAVGNVSEISDIAPLRESHAAPLTRLPSPEEQREAWREAVETAPRDEFGQPRITAAHVERVVEWK